MFDLKFSPDQEFIDFANYIVTNRLELQSGNIYKSTNNKSILQQRCEKKYKLKVVERFRITDNKQGVGTIKVGNLSGTIYVTHTHLIDKTISDDLLLYQIYWCLCKSMFMTRYGSNLETNFHAHIMVIDYFKNKIHKFSDKLFDEIVLEIDKNIDTPPSPTVAMLKKLVKTI